MNIEWKDKNYIPLSINGEGIIINFSCLKTSVARFIDVLKMMLADVKHVSSHT